MIETNALAVLEDQRAALSQRVEIGIGVDESFGVASLEVAQMALRRAKRGSAIGHTGLRRFEPVGAWLRSAP
jgi:hypothetical protein